jgi:Coenzyme PQQ synthesis protein D (PqqD)
MIVFTDRVVVPAHVMVRFLDSESVFLNLDTERYFGLDPTGTRMWQLLTAAANIEAAFQGLLGEFEVEPEALRADLVELVNKLVDNDLIQVLRSDVGTPSTI